MELKDLADNINNYLKFRNFKIREEDTILLAEIIEEFYSWRDGGYLPNNFDNKKELKNALKVFIERI